MIDNSRDFQSFFRARKCQRHPREAEERDLILRMILTRTYALIVVVETPQWVATLCELTQNAIERITVFIAA